MAIYNRHATPMPKNRHRQRMWLSMRVLRTFTTKDLAVTANTTLRHAQLYVAGLKPAGYVRELPHINKGRSVARSYRLVKDTGPNAPRVTDEGLSDLNTGEHFDLKGEPITYEEPDHEELA